MRDYIADAGNTEPPRSRNPADNEILRNYMANANNTEKPKDQSLGSKMFTPTREDWSSSVEISKEAVKQSRRNLLSQLDADLDQANKSPFSRLGQKLKRMSADINSYSLDAKISHRSVVDRREAKADKYSRHMHTKSKMVLPSSLDTVLEDLTLNDHISKVAHKQKNRSK